jgi:methionyl-tRNA formyltransferase
MVTSVPLRVAFFGTPAFAVPTLEALLASAHDVVGVVTQPDRPRGRGHKTTDAPVKVRAMAAGLPILQPSTLKDPGFLREFIALRPDLGVVAAYGRILPESLLAMPRLGLINVHASLLPRYRGAAPVHRAVIAGERETGVTIMQVVKELDAGPILAVRRLAIGDDSTSEDVERALAVLGASLLVEVADRLSTGPLAGTPQAEREATYARRLTKEDGVVNWARSARDIHNLIRGLHPWPHAFTFFDGARLILRRSAVPGIGSTDAPGTIVAARGDELRVATGDGLLDLREVQAEGKRPLTAREFLAGHHVPPGSRFIGDA